MGCLNSNSQAEYCSEEGGLTQTQEFGESLMGLDEPEESASQQQRRSKLWGKLVPLVSGFEEISLDDDIDEVVVGRHQS